jgi:hypothetical protein
VKKNLSALLSSGIIISTAIIILLLLVLYLGEIGISTPSPSYATDSLGYEIRELATFPVSNPWPSNDNNSSNSGAISANTTMTILPNSSKAVYETEAFVAPPTVKTFVIYMANEFHENWPEESHKLITNKNAYAIPTNLTISNGTDIPSQLS